MDSTYFLTFASAALLGAGGAALVGAYLYERSQRRALHADVSKLTAMVEQLTSQVTNYQRASHNKLYARSMRDIGFAAKQSLLRVRAVRSQLVEELDTIDKLLDISTLD